MKNDIAWDIEQIITNNLKEIHGDIEEIWGTAEEMGCKVEEALEELESELEDLNKDDISDKITEIIALFSAQMTDLEIITDKLKDKVSVN